MRLFMCLFLFFLFVTWNAQLSFVLRCAVVGGHFTIIILVSLFFLNHSFGQKPSHADSTLQPPLLSESNTDPTYQLLFCNVIEKEATFNNVSGDWEKFLTENLSKTAIENECPPGRYKVRIHFIISREGYVVEAKAITNHGYGMETEAIRIICSSPKWIPATRNGRNISFAHIQSITFDVCEETPVTYL